MVLHNVLSFLDCLIQEKLEFLKFQPLTNLRHLKWRVTASDGESLVYLISMVEAAPFLQKFTLEVTTLTS